MKLFFGSFGNGCNVCDASTIENSDYKKIAHIENYGLITFYIKPEKIPAADLFRIKRVADYMRSDFLKDFESWPLTRKFDFICDRLPAGADTVFITDKRPISDRITSYLNIVINNDRQTVKKLILEGV